MNVILGAWLLIAPWLLKHPLDARWNSLAAGALILARSLVKGTPTHRFGGGWSSLWKTDGQNDFSHGTQAEHPEAITAVRRIAQRLGRSVTVFPVGAVTMMAAITADAESSFPFDAWIHRFETGGPLPEAAAGRVALAAARVQRGDTVVIAAGVPVGPSGITDFIEVRTL